MKNSKFDINWRDDIFDPTVIDIPLILPRDIPRGSGDRIWVQSRCEPSESAFGQDIQHSSYRIIKYLLNQSAPPDTIRTMAREIAIRQLTENKIPPFGDSASKPSLGLGAVHCPPGEVFYFLGVA